MKTKSIINKKQKSVEFSFKIIQIFLHWNSRFFSGRILFRIARTPRKYNMLFFRIFGTKKCSGPNHNIMLAIWKPKKIFLPYSSKTCNYTVLLVLRKVIRRHQKAYPLKCCALPKKSVNFCPNWLRAKRLQSNNDQSVYNKNNNSTGRAAPK